MSRQGRYRTRTLENVKRFWEKEAAEWGESPQVTIRDHYFRLLEIRVTCALIEGRKNVLDVGCGTGFSTVHYAAHVGNVVGADYSPRMIERAERFLADRRYFTRVMRRYAENGWPRLGNNIRFEVGDVLALAFPPATFDGVVAQRVLINLPTVALQGKAVAEITRVLASGGLWISVEATTQGHRGVDRTRAVFGLPRIEKYWHNLYVDEDWFVRVAGANGLEIDTVVRFETYQFLTKILHPLIAPVAQLEFLSGFNKAAQIVSKLYPTYESIAAIGLEPFLGEEFRRLVQQLEPAKLHGYDRAVKKVLAADPDFTGCSHQVMYVLRKPGHDADSSVSDPDARTRRPASTRRRGAR